MIKCSVCKTSLTQYYCPNCGQKQTNRVVSIKTIWKDFNENFLSFDAGFLRNMKMMILNPNKLIQNYLNGFRVYYYSPSKMLLVSTLFLSFSFYFHQNQILGFGLGTGKLLVLLSFFLSLIILISASSKIVYRKVKRKYLEHFVVTTYILSFWLIFFTLLSIGINYLSNNFVNLVAQILFILLTFLWISKYYVRGFMKIVLLALLNLSAITLFFGLVFFALYLLRHYSII